MNGIDFGLWLRKEFPDVKVIFTSGIRDNASVA
jgi:hypothetical protein